MSSDTEKLIGLLAQLSSVNKHNRIEDYHPYPFQKIFHAAKGSNDELAIQKALMAANQVGKTFCAAAEAYYHASGRYPSWWEGVRFSSPNNGLVSGQTNDTVRDICQLELFGDPFDEGSEGTGTVPLKYIGKKTRKAGVPNAYSAVMVKHITGGWSKIRFMAYEQGFKAFMGVKFDWCWGDEEPPPEIWSQFLRAVFSRKHYIIFLTFTPEVGITELIADFMNNIKPTQALIRATWDDAPHMTEKVKDEFLSTLKPHERDMRTKGIPLMGSGLIWPVPDDDIKIEPFLIPDHWPRLCAIDFGIDHPFAAVWFTFDRDTETAYIYDLLRVSGQLVPMHASAIKRRGEWIPIMWPHDGIKRDPKSGVTLANSYRAEGLELHHEKFTNPPSPGQEEGKGGNGVEVGLFDIHNAMEEGRFKVFSNLAEWFEEKNMYHRKDGLVVAVREDIMSSTRYGFMSMRHARTKPRPPKPRKRSTTLSNW